MTVSGVLIVLAPLVMGVDYKPRDESENKQDILLKLSADINKVDHSIEVTKELIKNSPDAPYLADLNYRLAELHVERSRYVYARLMEQRPDGDSNISGEQALEVQISKRLAIETYTRILNEFPEYMDNDQIRFFRAHEHRELGEFDTMLNEYKGLIAKYPRSKWSIEARLILGDHHFDKGSVDDAEPFYKEILELSESHVHDMARYKLGWIRINQERFSEALRYFEDAVKSKRKKERGAVGDARSLDVKRESMMAMTWPYSEVRKAYEAPSYFRRLAESKTLYVAVLKKLANRYFVKTEYANASLLYREVVRLSASVDENIEYIQRTYEAVRNMSRKNSRRYANASADVAAMITNASRFQNHLGYGEEEKAQLLKDFEIRARDLATRLHVDSQKRRNTRSIRTAADAYRRYLSLYGTNKKSNSIRSNRASALFETKDFVEAGIQYEELALAMQEGDARRETIYKSILSYFNAIDADTLYRRKNPTKESLLDKLSAVRAREGLKQLGAYYVKKWPKDARVPNVKFNIAMMYYQQGQYEKSSELFTAFIETYPTHKDGVTAGNLALDSLNKMDDLDGLAKLAQRFVKNNNIRNTKFKKDALRIAEAARKRNVEMTVISTNEGDFTETMLAEWEKHKGTAEGEEFLYTGFVKFKNESNVAGVFDFGGRMIGAYPKSARLVDVFATMGAFAARAADFERAAVLFEEFYKRFPTNKSAVNLLASAANFRMFLGDFPNAMKDFEVLRTRGSPSQQRNAYLKMMRAYRESRNWAALARAARSALKADRNWLYASFSLGLALANQNETVSAQRELERASRLSPRNDEDREARGQVLFELGRLMQQRFEGIRAANAQVAEQAVQARLQLLEALEQTYVAAIQSGEGAWGIAALHEIARAYQDFGSFLTNLPAPAGMSAAERRQYSEALAQQGQVYTTKALDTQKACKAKAIELKVFTPFAAGCLAETLEPVQRVAPTRHRRPTRDASTEKRFQQLRQRLVKTPENIEVLNELARQAVATQDFHLAKLTLSKALEVDSGNGVAQNLMGVAQWSLGDPQGAYESFKQSRAAGVREAATNQAALFKQYGYENAARQALQAGGGGAGLELDAPDVHPAVRTMLREVGGS